MSIVALLAAAGPCWGATAQAMAASNVPRGTIRKAAAPVPAIRSHADHMPGWAKKHTKLTPEQYEEAATEARIQHFFELELNPFRNP